MFILSVCLMAWYTLMGGYCLLTHIWKPDPHKLFLVQGSLCLVVGFTNLAALNLKYLNLLKYIEWSLCSPLTILLLCLGGELKFDETISLMLFTESFCVCGALATITDQLYLKILLGAMGSVFSGVVIFRLYRLTRNSENKYVHSLLVTTACIYPFFIVTWYIGGDVLCIITTDQEYVVQTVLGLVLKSMCIVYLFKYYSTESIFMSVGNMGFRLAEVVTR